MRDYLGRDLGFYAVFTISIGAMIGSGIFVLPGLAESIAGPAVILAYLLAGVVVLPSALSKAEMATAMPEAGGTYLFIDRALGPMMGTVAGVGAWFSLVFKSAFALVGLGAYLVLFLGDVPVEAIALALGVALIGLNVMGVRKVGQLQAAIVTTVLAVLVAFVARGAIAVENANYQPFFPAGFEGLLATTGFVFVSYAGVTKIASIAEEVDDPGRTIPLGILTSIGVMMLVYTAIVFVIVGVTEPGQLGSTTPMAVAAEQFLGPIGATVIAVTAVLALTSMANAGILSASRYPFAMSRDRLLPGVVSLIHRRFRTPVAAIIVTGTTMLALIVFVPVLELAKLASAFQLLVFAIVNLAVIVFREGDPAHYRPTFRSPAYPWVQLFGIAATGVLIPFMGVTALLGAAGITLGGIAWYLAYGRPRTRRDGAALDALRRRADDRNLADVQEAMEAARPTRIVVPVDPDLPTERLGALLRIASDLSTPGTGRVQVLRLVEVPEQAGIGTGTEMGRRREHEWIGALATAAEGTDVQIEQEELLSHDAKRALVNHVRTFGADLVLAERAPVVRRFRLFDDEASWLMRHLPCDGVFVENRGYDKAERVLAIGSRAPVPPLVAATADRLAHRHDGRVGVLRTLGRRVGGTRLAATRRYQEALCARFTSPVTTQIVRDGPPWRSLAREAQDGDVAVVGTRAHWSLRRTLFGSFASHVARHLPCTVLMVHGRRPTERSRLGDVLGRLLR